MGTRTWSIGALLAVAAFAAACGSPNVPNPTPLASDVAELLSSPTASPTASPSPSQPEASPSSVQSAAAVTPSPAPRATSKPSPKPTPKPKPTPIAWTDNESFLMGGIRSDAMGACEPRRANLPGTSVAGVECRPAAAFVARVGAYLFTDPDDMYDTYRQRLAEHGVDPDTGGCYAGTSGDSSWASSFAPVDESKPWAHAGCYLDENNIANVRVTCDNGIYIGVLGTNADMRALFMWAMKNPPEVGGMPGYGLPPGICIGTGFEVY